LIIVVNLLDDIHEIENLQQITSLKKVDVSDTKITHHFNNSINFQPLFYYLNIALSFEVGKS